MAINTLDLRLVKVDIEVNGVLNSYADLFIHASGSKFANSQQNECEIKIYNLNKKTRDFILSESSPYNFNRTAHRITLSAGRQSYGLSKIFQGEVIFSNPSMPPDISLTLKCMTGNFLKNKVISYFQPDISSLKQISTDVAKNLGVTLNFLAVDKNITNYNFNGSATQQIKDLEKIGGVDVFLDDDELIIKNKNAPILQAVKVLNLESGLIGIPEITEMGVRVKFLFDNNVKLGGLLKLESKIYPDMNGNYLIYKLSFDIANRDLPFYYIAEAKRLKK